MAKGPREKGTKAKKARGKSVKKKWSGKHKKPGKKEVDPEKKKLKQRERDAIEIKELENRILIEVPASASELLAETGAAQDKGPVLTKALFADMPISQRTLRGLEAGGFKKMTKIQKAAIPFGLRGRDILGEAKTGSGKTLSFLVPCIEKLYRLSWSAMDGLGAMIISPTRELAHQIFAVQKTIGAHHDISAGCVVGGRDLKEERQRVANVNILIGTPGRLLQHLDETAAFNADELKLLILDEADRILDLGFKQTMANLIDHLPPPSSRQNFLFSATLHGAVSELARCSLENPEKIAVHETRTPAKLRQLWMPTSIEQKVSTLFSFLRAHSQCKMIVFVAACKEVRFLYEAFYRLKPGPAVMELHGRQSLEKRMFVFDAFTKKERAAALICTDVAARGVDFPAVDWVIQMDCPDSVETYIHRVGRTARYTSGGNSLLLLQPQEEAFVPLVEAQKLAISKMGMNKKKMQPLTPKLQSLCAENPDVKHLAQKAFLSYLRSVQLMPNKKVFDASKIDRDQFAESLGLAITPEMKGEEAGTMDANDEKKKKNMTPLQRLKEKIRARKAAKAAGAELPPEEEEEAAEEGKKKLSKRERRDARIARAAQPKEREAGAEGEEDDLLELAKPAEVVAEEVEAAETQSVKKSNKSAKDLDKKKVKLRLGKDGVAKGSKGTILLDEDDDVLADVADARAEEVVEDAAERSSFVARMAEKLRAQDEADTKAARKRIKEKHFEERQKMRGPQVGADGGEEVVAMLGGASDDENSVYGSDEEDAASGSEADGAHDFGGSDDEFAGYDDNVASCSEDERPAKKPKKSKKETSTDGASTQDLEAMALAALQKL